MEDFTKNINFKKIGNISFIVAMSVLTYYGLSAYKTYLEIKTIKRKEKVNSLK
jgi:hypothetical protein